MNSIQSITDFVKLLREDLPPRCSTCAFTTGTVPNLAWNTKMKSEMCVLSGEPFLCHEPDRVDGDGPVACVGWIQAVLKKSGDGYYSKLEPWRKALYEGISELLTEVENAAREGRTFDFDEHMRKMLLVAELAGGGR